LQIYPNRNGGNIKQKMHILHNYFSRLVVLQKSYFLQERRA
jgi:hypothetical protein